MNRHSRRQGRQEKKIEDRAQEEVAGLNTLSSKWAADFRV